MLVPSLLVGTVSEPGHPNLLQLRLKPMNVCSVRSNVQVTNYVEFGLAELGERKQGWAVQEVQTMRNWS